MKNELYSYICYVKCMNARLSRILDIRLQNNYDDGNVRLQNHIPLVAQELKRVMLHISLLLVRTFFKFMK